MSLSAVARRLRRPEPPAPQPAREPTPLDELVRAVDEREPSGSDHAAAVAALATAIARELELETDEVETVEVAGYVHDVGKALLPASILTKPAALSAREWLLVRRHPLHGVALLLGRVPLAVVAAVRAHHERWDGLGYPDRTAGDRIPRAARVVAVADAFCAIREPRPYRELRPWPEALAEIEAASGRQFDPACVKALHRVLRKDAALR